MAENNNYVYEGSELELFDNAKNWKNYFSKKLRKHIIGDVLEVGAGIGSNTEIMLNSNVTSWTCLEPDESQLSILKTRLGSKNHNLDLKYECGTTENLTKIYNTIIYIDVLEHIEFDAKELAQTAEYLSEGGKIIVLSPAYQFLFSEFDHSIGHYRRYNKRSIKSVTPATLNLDKLFYLDSVGLMTSLVNKYFLKQSIPTISQIKFWDRVIVSLSKVIDKVLFHSMGRSIIAIWVKK